MSAHSNCARPGSNLCVVEPGQMHPPNDAEETAVPPIDWRIARAVHDITRFRTRVIKGGSLGRIVDIESHGGDVNYTVEFAIPHTCGATVRLEGLTGSDVEYVEQSVSHA